MAQPFAPPPPHDPYPAREGFHSPYTFLNYGPQYAFSTRLAVYDIKTGKLRGVVDDPLEFTFHASRGAVPTLEVKWTYAKESHRLLGQPCYVALQYRVSYHKDGVLDTTGAVVWHEYRDSRFYLQETSWDRTDPTMSRTSTFAGVMKLLDGSRVWNGSSDTAPSSDDKKPEDDGTKRRFNNRTAGDIVHTLFNEAKKRGEVPALKLGFTPDVDSFGNKWDEKITREYEKSTDLMTLVYDLYKSGIADVWTDHEYVHMSNVGSWEHYYNNDFYRTYIRDGMVPNAPQKTSWVGNYDRVLVQGEKGLYLEKASGEIKNPYGSRSNVVAVGGLRDLMTADIVAIKELEVGDHTATTWTREYTYVDDGLTPELPLRNFTHGDIIFMDTEHGTKEKVRVQDFSLRFNNNGTYGITVTAGDLRDEWLVELAESVNGLTENSKVATTGKPKPQMDIDTHKWDSKGHKLPGGMTANDFKGIHADTSSGGNSFHLNPTTGAASIAGELRSGNYSQLDTDPSRAALRGESDDTKYPQLPFIEITDEPDPLYTDKRTTPPTPIDGIVQMKFNTKYDWDKSFSSARLATRAIDRQDSDKDVPGDLYIQSGVRPRGNYGTVHVSEDHSELAWGSCDNGIEGKEFDYGNYPLQAGGGPNSSSVRAAKDQVNIRAQGKVTIGSTDGNRDSNKPQVLVTKQDITLNPFDMYGRSNSATKMYLSFGMASLEAPDASIKTSGSTSVSADKYFNHGIKSTTSSYSNVVRNSKGQLFYTSSLSKYKLDQQELDVNSAIDAVLDLTPKTWVDKQAQEDNPEDTSREVGYVAEDVAAVSAAHDDVLEPVLTYDDDGKLNGIDYSRLPDPYTVAMFKHMAARIAELEAQVEQKD